MLRGTPPAPVVGSAVLNQFHHGHGSDATTRLVVHTNVLLVAPGFPQTLFRGQSLDTQRASVFLRIHDVHVLHGPPEALILGLLHPFELKEGRVVYKDAILVLQLPCELLKLVAIGIRVFPGFPAVRQ